MGPHRPPARWHWATRAPQNCVFSVTWPRVSSGVPVLQHPDPHHSVRQLWAGLATGKLPTGKGQCQVQRVQGEPALAPVGDPQRGDVPRAVAGPSRAQMPPSHRSRGHCGAAPGQDLALRAKPVALGHHPTAGYAACPALTLPCMAAACGQSLCKLISDI